MRGSRWPIYKKINNSNNESKEWKNISLTLAWPTSHEYELYNFGQGVEFLIKD